MIGFWKDVVGYEGIYEVSRSGEVRTHKNKISFSKRFGVERKWKQRVLKQKVNKDRSRRVNLWADGKEKTHLVHRLVANAFLPTDPDRVFVNHIDGNRLNNSIENLEWCTSKENNNHAFDTGLIQTGHEIVLYDNELKQSHFFRSKSKASKFLGKNQGYVSHLLNRGDNRFSKYTILEKKTN